MHLGQVQLFLNGAVCNMDPLLHFLYYEWGPLVILSCMGFYAFGHTLYKLLNNDLG